MSCTVKTGNVSKGGKIKVMFNYSFRITDNQYRMGMTNSKNGSIFEVAQWYPRMCVWGLGGYGGGSGVEWNEGRK